MSATSAAMTLQRVDIIGTRSNVSSLAVWSWFQRANAAYDAPAFRSVHRAHRQFQFLPLRPHPDASDHAREGRAIGTRSVAATVRPAKSSRSSIFSQTQTQ
jgi:hypothetical protein